MFENFDSIEAILKNVASNNKFDYRNFEIDYFYNKKFS